MKDVEYLELTLKTIVKASGYRSQAELQGIAKKVLQDLANKRRRRTINRQYS